MWVCKIYIKYQTIVTNQLVLILMERTSSFDLRTKNCIAQKLRCAKIAVCENLYRTTKNLSPPIYVTSGPLWGSFKGRSQQVWLFLLWSVFWITKDSKTSMPEWLFASNNFGKKKEKKKKKGRKKGKRKREEKKGKKKDTFHIHLSQEA